MRMTNDDANSKSSIALVVLLSDGIESLFPGHDPLLVRCASFLILTPTLFIPVRHLSYTSLLGILSVFSLLAVILYDGLSKPNAPGSLHEMAAVTYKLIFFSPSPQTPLFSNLYLCLFTHSILFFLGCLCIT